MSQKIDARVQQEILDALMKVQAYVENLEPQKSCASCQYYIDNAGICEKFRQSPPEHVKLEGCEGWEVFNNIPF